MTSTTIQSIDSSTIFPSVPSSGYTMTTHVQHAHTTCQVHRHTHQVHLHVVFWLMCPCTRTLVRSQPHAFSQIIAHRRVLAEDGRFKQDENVDFFFSEFFSRNVKLLVYGNLTRSASGYIRRLVIYIAL